MQELLSIFQYDFMVRAFIAGAIVACIAPMIGTFLVVKRYSLMFDTLAHVALAGVAVGLLTNTQPVYTAVALTVLGAIAIEWLRDKGNIYGESVLAIFLSGSLAVAVVLISIADGFTVDLFSFLFGSITTVSAVDVRTIAVLGAVVFATIMLLYKEFFLTAFDEELAKSSGLRTSIINTIIVVLAAVTVALSMRIVGALLIGAMMVIPVITGIRVNRSFKGTMITAMLCGLLSVVTGLFLSYFYDLASGGTIVVVSLVLFMVSLLMPKQ